MNLWRTFGLSLLNVIRAGQWSREWWVSIVRAVVGVAIVAVAGLAISTRWPSPFGLDGAAWPERLWVVAAPAIAYVLLGGALIDHFVSRVGALITWTVHLLWSLVFVGVLLGLALGAGAAAEDLRYGGTLAGAAILAIPAVAAIVAMLYTIPESFPQASNVYDTARELTARYDDLRDRLAGRAPQGLDPDAPPPYRRWWSVTAARLAAVAGAHLAFVAGLVVVAGTFSSLSAGELVIVAVAVTVPVGLYAPAGLAIDHLGARLGVGISYLTQLAGIVVLSLPIALAVAATGGLPSFDAGSVALAGPQGVRAAVIAAGVFLPLGALLGSGYFLVATLIKGSFPTRAHWRAAKADAAARREAARRQAG